LTAGETHATILARDDIWNRKNMTMPTVRAARADELEKVLQTVTLAFSADPLMRWFFTGADDYLSRWPELIRAYCGVSVANGSTFVSDDFGGAAMWMPPGLETDEAAMGEFVVKNIRPEIIEEFGELLGQMDHYHPHDVPCWYLAVIGVDGFHQGKGLGSILLKHTTRMLDDTGTIGYLESSNPANISLYQRHGFEIMGEIRVGSAPLVTPMIRQPQ
jgi:ribosomal protein S18 acetylase RimI-like enzyme